MTSHVVRPTLPTRIALLSALLAIAGTSAFLLARYPGLPDILPVRFGRAGFPIG